MRATLFLILICLTFILFPQIDIEISKLFYYNGFYLKDTIFAKLIYKVTIFTIALFTLGLLMFLLYQLFAKKEIIAQRVLLYLLLVLLLGPGLIVNEVFKNHFGRARPSQIKEFGGDKEFSPAFVITNQCQKNCSFSSGHAAAAFYFLALIPLFHERKRKIVASLAILWGSLVGFVRIVQGGHFLSDVVCSALIVWIISLLLYKLIMKGKI